MQSVISPSLTAAFYRKYPQTFIYIYKYIHISWRSPYNNFTDRETEAHVPATVNPQTSSHRLFFFFFQCFPFVGNMSIHMWAFPHSWGTSHALPLLSQFSSLCTHSVLHPGTNQGPQTTVSESEALPISAFKADLFSSTEIFFSSVILAALLSFLLSSVLSPAKPSGEGLQLILHYTDPPPACFFVAYGQWGYSLSFTSVSRLITLIFLIPKSIWHFPLQASLVSELWLYLHLFFLNYSGWPQHTSAKPVSPPGGSDARRKKIGACAQIFVSYYKFTISNIALFINY